MTTLELFKKHRKGEVSRERFLYEVRRDNNLPWITNTTSYNDAVKILKNKGIVRESVENVATDPAVDRVNPYFLKRGVNKILDGEKELTNDSYINALNKAAKQLHANPHAFDKEMFANADTVEKADAKLETKPVKNGNHVDKDNGMKKVKGQEAPKAMSAPTKENKKGKPKGVKVMPDKGVTGTQKIIKEISDFIKKKLNENNTFNDFHIGRKVETKEGPATIKEVDGGTLTVETEGGKLMAVQMSEVNHYENKKKEAAENPKQEENELKEYMTYHSFHQIGDIQSHVETSSVLPTSFKEFFLREWALFEVDVERGKYRTAYYGLEEYEDELQYALRRSPGEFEEVYKPMFDELRSALERELGGEEEDDMDYENELDEKVGQVVDKSTGDTVQLFRDPSKAQQFVNTQPSDVRSQLIVRK